MKQYSTIEGADGQPKKLSIIPVDFSAEYRVYYEDTDVAGVVYHANYLKFMERARTDWLIGLGYHPQQPANSWGIIFTVRFAALDFKKPAYLGDSLSVSINLVTLLGASLEVQQQISCDRGILVSGKIRIACLDSERFTVRRIPIELRNRFKR